MNKRIQRKRVKGWRMPKGAKSVCRPGKWGNPMKVIDGIIYIDASYRRKELSKWVILCDGTIDEMLAIYQAMWSRDYCFIEKITKGNDSDVLYWIGEFMNMDIREIFNVDLACFCALDAKCHADILLNVAKEVF